jgi:hypothetical protein
MGDANMTLNEYRSIAEDCLRQAYAAEDERDRPLWATMAQSWLLLAEHARQLSSDEELVDEGEAAELVPSLN